MSGINSLYPGDIAVVFRCYIGAGHQRDISGIPAAYMPVKTGLNGIVLLGSIGATRRKNLYRLFKYKNVNILDQSLQVQGMIIAPLVRTQ